MKNSYKAPEISVVNLEKMDILTASGGGGGNAVLPDDDF